MNNIQEPVRLTQYAKAAGCSCKIASAQLQEILAGAAPHFFPGLLVGNGSSDDAAVYALDDETALIATTDFFTPVADDAFDYGRIAAANALSDVYAMGGKPLMALAILGWPTDILPAALARQVIEGGRAACADAGIPLAGGHSITAAEPFFGLCVNGLVSAANLKKNNTATEGDLLFLTKPIGTGILTTAKKRGMLPDDAYAALVAQLSSLNRIGTQLGSINGITAMTDVTGFGLLGHLIEMAAGSGLSAVLQYSGIPMLSTARELAAKQVVPDATYRNWNSYSPQVSIEPGVNVMEAFNLLPDPQTNGGLLFSVKESAIAEVTELLTLEGYGAFATPIGRLSAKGGKTIVVTP
jgi:selenide,water dikinase